MRFYTVINYNELQQATIEADEADAHDLRMEKSNEAVTKLQSQPLLDNAFSQDNYDYVGMHMDGNSFEPMSETQGVKLPNKYLKRDQMIVAGHDVSANNVIASRFDDTHGLIEDGVIELRNSYTDSVNGLSAEAVPALSKVALGVQLNGSDYATFAAEISGVPEEHKLAAWNAATGAANEKLLIDAIENNQIAPVDYEFPEMEDEFDIDQLRESENYTLASRALYKTLLGEEFKGTDQEAQDFAFRHMSQVNWNVPYLAMMANRAMNGNDETKRQIYAFLVLDERMGASWEQTGRNLESLALDPFTYIGLGVGNVASKTAQYAAKRQLAGWISKSLTKPFTSTAANTGTIYGAGFTGIDDYFKQAIEVEATDKEEIDLGQTAKMTGLGAAGGYITGGLLTPETYRTGSKIVKNAYEKFLEMPPAPSMGGAASQRGSVGDPNLPATISEPVLAEPTYLEIEKALVNLPKKANPAEYQKQIQNLVDKGKIKKDELLWSGIDDWLDVQRNDKISREDIESFLTSNSMKMEKRVIGKEGGDVNDDEFLNEIWRNRDFVIDEHMSDSYASDYVDSEFDHYQSEARSGDMFTDELEEASRQVVAKSIGSITDELGFPEIADSDDLVEALKDGRVDVVDYINKVKEIGDKLDKKIVDAVESSDYLSEEYMWEARSELNKRSYRTATGYDRERYDADLDKLMLRNAMINVMDDVPTHFEESLRDPWLVDAIEDTIMEYAESSAAEYAPKVYRDASTGYEIIGNDEYGDGWRVYDDRNNLVDDYATSRESAIDEAWNHFIENGNYSSQDGGDDVTQWKNMSWEGEGDTANLIEPYTETMFTINEDYMLEKFGRNDTSASGHFSNQDNLLAHVRSAGYKDNNFKKNRMIFEMQSDWHQGIMKSRKRKLEDIGEALNESPTDLAKIFVRENFATPPSGNLWAKRQRELMKEGDKAYNKFVSLLKGSDQALADGEFGKISGQLKYNALVMASRRSAVDPNLSFNEAMESAFEISKEVREAAWEDFGNELIERWPSVFPSYSGELAKISGENGADLMHILGTDYMHLMKNYSDNVSGSDFDTDKHMFAQDSERGDFAEWMKEQFQTNVNLQKAMLAEQSTRAMQRAFIQHNQADAPMASNWHESIFRQMVRDAVENDFDRVSWPSEVRQIEDIEGWGRGVKKDGDKYMLGSNDVTPIINRYLKDLPKYANKFSSKLGGEPIRTSKIDVDGNIEVVNTIELTDEIKAAARKGFPLFQIGTSALGAGYLTNATMKNAEQEQTQDVK